jgi:uncharacterized Zn-binding protein involved in type VI secretion
MPGAARITDSILGMTAGEHSGHTDEEIHSSSALTGLISGNCSPNVFINGLEAAYVGSVTTEYDSCCGSSSGSVAEGSPNVFVNGKPLARKGDSIQAHSGYAHITGGSSNVFINGG